MKIYSKNTWQPALGKASAMTHSIHGTELSLISNCRAGFTARSSAWMVLMSISILLPLHDNLSRDGANPGVLSQEDRGASSSTEFLRGQYTNVMSGPSLPSLIRYNCCLKYCIHHALSCEFLPTSLFKIAFT